MIHAVLQRDKDVYVAECLEVAVVTQGRTLDEVVSNLREAIALHLEGEEGVSLGLAGTKRLQVVGEFPLVPDVAEA
jgi:predicted RNase H-like HicB family nuclease